MGQALRVQTWVMSGRVGPQHKKIRLSWSGSIGRNTLEYVLLNFA